MPAKKVNKKNDNLKLWDSVSETNPSITKRVETRGGFTAIDAYSQIKEATKLWGSFGCKWGLRDLCYTFTYDGDKPIGIALVATFFYPINSTEVKFPTSSDMAYKPGNDCYKKLSTDVLTKALSRLGYNADVFLGKFDSNKYVAEMKAKYSNIVPDVKVFTPDAKAMELLDKIAAKYVEVDGIYFQDNVVDMDKLKAAVFNKYGKYPSKEGAVDKIVNEIESKDVSVKK